MSDDDQDDDSGLLIAVAALLAGAGLFLFLQNRQAAATAGAGAGGGTQPPQLPPPASGDGGGYGGGTYTPPSSYTGGGGGSSDDGGDQAPAASHMSAAALNRIKQHEGLRLAKYADAGGWSIGYGHHYGAGQTPPATITAAQAQALLLADVAAIDAAMAGAIHVPLNQNQWDAVGDLVYNIGAGAFRSSTLLSKLNANDMAGAAAEFARWIYTHDASGAAQVAPTLVTLRAAEKALFLTPATTA